MKNLAKVFSTELEGVNAKLIEVEVDLNVGLHAINIVGLADKALSEAKERVSSALKNSGIKPPSKENKRITINLAPADIKKTGSQYDLSIAIGYLLATEQIKNFETNDKIFIGELALDGTLRPVSGALSTAQLAKELGFKFILLPSENAKEAGLVQGIKIIPIKNLREVIDYLENRKNISSVETNLELEEKIFPVDFSEIKGQENAKRALMIAAAGGHNLLLVGPPGTGKSMLSQALISILPPMSLAEVIEVTKIWSAAGLNIGIENSINSRPFRSPHHSASPVSVIGGGTNPKPGEISLAHRGILFLDELPEFRRDLLESLRQPLENGTIFVSRAKNTIIFPARFTLVSAMNPCPCGYFGDEEKECRCSAYEVFRYQKKISGPLLDRIDIQINVPRIKIEELRKPREEKSSQKIREVVALARERQANRFKKLNLPIFTNSEMSSKQCDQNIILNPETESFLKNVLEGSFISARSYYRILKTARTIADLEGADNVEIDHLAEAFGYRIKQKE